MSAADHIRSCPVPVRTVIYGNVASAGSIMSVAATEQALIMPHATFLVHQHSGFMYGRHSEMIIAAYTKFRKLIKRKRLRSLLRDEKVMFADEAIANHFCDGFYTK
jgi:ATP-dependent protease ClpP protease subunit